MLTKLPPPRNTTLYHVEGTETFRLASKALELGDYSWGCNLQNVNKSMRRIYVADPGYTLIQVDQAGAEALIVAYLCLPGKYRQLFLHGIKVHVFVALHLFADVWRKYLPEIAAAALSAQVKDLSSIPDWKKLDKLIKDSDDWPNKKYPNDQRYYFIGKKLAHSSNYGQGANRLALSVLKETNGQVVLTKKEAEGHLNMYHALFPEIIAWHFRVKESLKKDKMLRNLFGYPRLVTKEPTDNEIREWIAFVPQSTVGTITNIAFTKLQNYIEDNNKNWHLLATTHDSYMAEVPDEEVPVAVPIMLDFITPELTSPSKEIFRMKAEAQTGKNWAPAKESNPDGLKEYKAA